MRKLKTQPQCNCLAQVNKQLAESNCQVAVGFQMNFDTRKCRTLPYLSLQKIDAKSRKKLPSLVCVYCPFCGTKYPE